VGIAHSGALRLRARGENFAASGLLLRFYSGFTEWVDSRDLKGSHGATRGVKWHRTDSQLKKLLHLRRMISVLNSYVGTP